jgi:hypothetical protein
VSDPTDPILDALLRAKKFADEELQVILDSCTICGDRATLDEDDAKYVDRYDAVIAQLKAAIAARKWERAAFPTYAKPEPNPRGSHVHD